MSYSLNTPCHDCKQRPMCTDRHILYGAVQAIHAMPYGVGHKGCGNITLNCSAYVKD